MYYFEVFYKQIKNLPTELNKRKEYILNICDNAINNFEKIKNAGVSLDLNSDGSHLTHWKKAITMFSKEIGS